MSKKLYEEDNIRAIASAIRGKNGAQQTYKISDMPNAIANIPTGSSTLVTKTITENGSYDPADDNADGYSRVTVDVAGGGSGSGPILSGTASPSASLGTDQDIYIQYSLITDHVYAFQIEAEYRKVDGSWEAYNPFNPPVGSVAAVRVWTATTGTTDASLYVQFGTFDDATSEFYALEEAEHVVYVDINRSSKIKNCHGLVYLDYGVSYGNKWTLKAIHDISGYSAGDVVAQWYFGDRNDVLVKDL